MCHTASLPWVSGPARCIQCVVCFRISMPTALSAVKDRGGSMRQCGSIISAMPLQICCCSVLQTCHVLLSYQH